MNGALGRKLAGVEVEFRYREWFAGQEGVAGQEIGKTGQGDVSANFRPSGSTGRR